jgi:protein tyrosine phosphatase (PTP) superfamily phosphohydrolase (DUF442 family)
MAFQWVINHHLEIKMAFQWVIKGRLARGPRPRNGKKKNWSSQVSKSTVDRWIKSAKSIGIRSVICLLDERPLNLYQRLPLGLPSYVRRKGLKVEHVPVRLQPGSVPTKQLRAVWQAYQRLPKPILVHCSAGRKRSKTAASYLLRKIQS